MISIVYGTRPEFLKIKPLIQELKKNSIDYKLIKIKQQIDLCSQFESHVEIEIENNCSRLNSIFSILPKLEKEFTNSKYVLVHGDTATSFVSSICAFNMNIKVIHLEAGLRTYDKQNPFPEEAYRQVISCLSEIHLCPTNEDKINLLNEMKSGVFHVVGNTILDNLKNDKSSSGSDVLITLHRRENLKNIEEWIKEIEKISLEFENNQFIFIKHPNPVVSKASSIFKNVKVIDPLSYEKLIEKLKNCKFVITDSGGLQEECSWFGKKVLVCRETTERKQTLGKSSLLCDKPENLKIKLLELLNINTVELQCPFGDGFSSEKIIKILKDIL